MMVWNITYFSLQFTKWFENYSMIFLHQTSVLTTRVWMVTVLQRRQRPGNADVTMAGKGKTVMFVRVIREIHVTIETKIFIKTQILFLKDQLSKKKWFLKLFNCNIFCDYCIQSFLSMHTSICMHLHARVHIRLIRFRNQSYMYFTNCLFVFTVLLMPYSFFKWI